ncbi:VOC family protein [Paenibacillus kandeliae]|uniref:VOC family protein n=1 Tax=Paenibacillus kandeliae TaxID=3231269 RepID=UPI0034575A98
MNSTMTKVSVEISKPLIHGLGHITISVSDMKRSVHFYQTIFQCEPVLSQPKTVYFDVAGMWWALNIQNDITREDIHSSYTHIALAVSAESLPELELNVKKAGAEIETGRKRDVEGEGQSIYFRDPDGHLLEFHTGTLQQRLDYYNA